VDPEFVTPLHVTELSQLWPGLDEKPDTSNIEKSWQPNVKLLSIKMCTVFPPVNPVGV
jgi:hypothetical protein